MHTLRLHISDGIYDKLIWFLARFDKSEIEIIQEDSAFVAERDYLHKELQKIDAGEMDFVSADELNAEIENAIARYEN